MKHRYSGFLGEPGFSGGRRRKVKGDFSQIPDSVESRFMGLVVANNNDLTGNKVKKQQRRYRSHIGLDIFLLIVFVVVWIIGRNM
ncbi:MAG: hypothetical protein IJ444_06565 [Kiritimatiellae bacterium]|nr:hypothetical protein [Kiritimatiellia bacterium]